MSQQPFRPIKRLLIANRGEIATRILSTARELNIETYTLYTTNDSSHTLNSTHSIQLPSPSSYLDISTLSSIVQKHNIDAIHPGYGFLSESAEFTERMWREANAVVVGPGFRILERTGDKLMARNLAQECHVPILPALQVPTDDVTQLQEFASKVGYPIIIKAVDGGGGRGIRIVTQEDELQGMLKAALRESPSKKVFAEKAAVDGYRHVEVQIIGDGQGGVRHLWERECSIQRRFQKVVEFAPCSITDRLAVEKVIESALRMARKVNYYSLGTFEFLVRQSPPEFYFLEINPRLQVEHSITECLASGIDLVKVQLLLAQGCSLLSLLPQSLPSSPLAPPHIHSLQLRITAESPSQNFSLSPGKVSSFYFPSGNGIRVDTHLHPSIPAIIGTDFDSLLAKLIITAPTWQDVVARAKRALEDTVIIGIESNLDLLRAIIDNDAFEKQECDTRWLEKNLPVLLRPAKKISEGLKNSAVPVLTSSIPPLPSSSSVVFRPRDAWNIELTPDESFNSNAKPGDSTPIPYHMQITRILTNNFPSSLKANIIFASPSTTTKPTPYTLSLTSSSSTPSSQQSSHRLGNPQNSNHITTPFPGKLIEICVEKGDQIVAGHTICVIRQMKMEVEVRSQKDGVVKWVFGDGEEDRWEEKEEGENVGVGILDAATIPLVYLTSIYSLFNIGNLQKGQSVLIHSATGGVGLSCIQLCQYIGAEIFVTVGTEEKRQLLSEKYGIPHDHMFSSRNTKFASEIMEVTDGKGIDVIINSLTGELLDASWRICADGGSMIEIGKKDMVARSYLSMEPFDRNCSFKAVDFSYTKHITDKLIAKLLTRIFDLLEAGHIGPVHPITTFPFDDIAASFAFMRSGRHIGKIVITREENASIELPVRPPTKKLRLRHDVSYLIVGGLKGLCGSLAVHMARNGAKHIISMLRSGCSDQKSQGTVLNCKALGCEIQEAKGDVSSIDDVKNAFKAANKPIGGVIQGAMVLRDKPFEIMTIEDYHTTVSSKVQGTWNLHNVALEQETPLDFFTMLSSISGVIGQKGQANYSAGNVFMDAFASYRQSLNLPANAVDLGVIQDVGYVAEQGGMTSHFDDRQWTGINEQILRKILSYSIFQQVCPINKASSAQLITGIAVPLPDDSPLIRDARFGHLFANTDSSGSGKGSADDSSKELQVFLLLYRSGAEAVPMVAAAVEVVNMQFTKMLRLDEPMEVGKPLSVYGLDSLSAVEFRNWVRMELGAELTTLDITNASSLTSLCEKIVAKMPPLTKSG
ncbi:uncharacterized protein EAF01_008170 [Botrytis porri]|uniref:uncharacterized protein n=1 Tax=Botrytis porri TaxID=87229 RepID=UPI0018FF4CCC|nr:uncharacterized protein EAF01_008170 [Botrytis porri]KAF7898957.1 hypothetical protein EAF01_008170 [Botrytis porri]